MKSSKVVLVLEYNGANYRGWQTQKNNKKTIQAYVEKAISKVANHPVSIICAGRTDAKVHASAQVIHFETSAEREERAWVFGVNTHLPSDIAVIAASQIDDDFHARFSAVSRRYRYVIYSSPLRPAILSDEVTWTYKKLDVLRMEEAARSFIGTHDFSSFRAAGCQSHSPVRTILHFDVFELGRYIVLDVMANAFLYHMIRNFAGVLMAIGAEEKPIEWAQDVLDAKNRAGAGITAPAAGLYFVHAGYSPNFNVPQVPIGPHFLPEFK